MIFTLYGISSCDTVRRARAWLDERGVPYHFHDFKKSGADPEKLAHWVSTEGWETILNRRGTTFRGLDEDQKAGLDAQKAVQIMLARTSTIKRPLLEHPGGLLVGFNQQEWEGFLA